MHIIYVLFVKGNFFNRIELMCKFLPAIKTSTRIVDKRNKILEKSKLGFLYETSVISAIKPKKIVCEKQRSSKYAKISGGIFIPTLFNHTYK